MASSSPSSSSSSCSISISRYFLFHLSILLLFHTLLLVTPAATSTTTTTTPPPAFTPDQFASFEYQSFDNHSNYNSQITLSGDAKVDDTSSATLQITGSWNTSSGRAMYKTPIKLAEPKNPRLKYSFGTHFTFSISPESGGDGLAFFLIPESNSTSYNHHDDGTSFGLKSELVDRETTAFAVEFDTKTDPQYGDMNDNHIGIDVGGLVSVKVTNASKLKIVLNSGEKIRTWIDYEASSKRVEVRLSSSSTSSERPIDPELSCPIDLSEMFKNKRVVIGLSSSNADSRQVTRVFSWGFKLRPVPYWTHSQPLDPEAVLGGGGGNEKEVGGVKQPGDVMGHRKSECVLRVVTAVFVGTGCGALGAFVVLMVWSLFGNRRQPVVPASEEDDHQFVEYDCDKVKVLVVGTNGAGGDEKVNKKSSKGEDEVRKMMLK